MITRLLVLFFAGCVTRDRFYEGGKENFDADGDGVDAEPVGLDCDDDDVEIGPGQVEICGDGKDNDCVPDNCATPEFVMDPDAVTRWLGAAAQDQLGAAVASVAWGEDGAALVAVGAPGQDDAGYAAGAVYLVAPLRGQGTLSLSGQRITGGEAGAKLGSTLYSGSDLDGDGSPDLVLGAPGAGDGDGAIYAFLSAPAAADLSATEADLVVSGSAGARGGLGGAITGFTAADGTSTLLLGAPYEGRVWLLPAGELGVTSVDAASLWGSTSARVGAAVAVANVDGMPVLAVGAPYAATTEGGDSTHGGAAGLVPADELADVASLDDTGLLRGVADLDRLGASLASADLDDDGLPELLIGAPGVSKVYVVDGDALRSQGWVADSSDWSVLSNVLSGPTGSEAGASLAVSADQDGDGVAEVLVGAPAASVDGVETSGAFWLLLSEDIGWRDRDAVALVGSAAMAPTESWTGAGASLGSGPQPGAALRTDMLIGAPAAIGGVGALFLVPGVGE